MKLYILQGHPSNFTVTRAEKLTIWIQFEITRPVAAIKSLRFALFLLIYLKLCFHVHVFVSIWNMCDFGFSCCITVSEIELDTRFSLSFNQQYFLAATKQLYEWYFLSVCLSVTPFWLCSHHRIIMKFSGVITLDQGKVHAKGQGQRSKVKVTEVTTQIFVSGL